jgi:hypothetical protein
MFILSVVAIVRFPSLKYGDRLLIFGFLSYALYNFMIAWAFKV